MILADTSVWVYHLRSGSEPLSMALEKGEVLTHPHVIGELACGNLRDRAAFLRLLSMLPRSSLASDAEALACIESNRLQGRGLGWVDVHLLASALLDRCQLWTMDKALAREATRCGIRSP